MTVAALPREEEKQTSLLDYLALLRRHYRLISFTCMAAILATFIFTRLTPRTYRAQSTLFVYADIAFQNALTSTQSPYLIASSPALGYVLALLKSHTIADEVAKSIIPELKRIAKGNHMIYDPAWDHPAVHVATSEETDNRLISISVDTSDAYISSATANAYVDAVNDHIINQARHQTLYISSLMSKTRSELSQAENALEIFQKTHPGMEAATASISSISERTNLEKSLVSDQIQLAENRELSRTTGSVDELVRLKSENSAIQARMAATKAKLATLGAQIKKLPGNSIELARLQEGVKVKEGVYEMLVQQHESASLREQQDVLPYKIIDRAVPEFALISPNMKKNLLFGFAGGLMFGILLAFVSDYIEGLARLR